MSGPRPLASPSTFRLVAASAAAVASLGVVALGVQLGTNGLLGNGPGRNPGSASAAPAAAVVDARRAVPTAGSTSLEQAIQALAPTLGGGAFGSSGGLGGSATGAASPTPTAAETPAPADGGASGGGGAAPSLPQAPAAPVSPPVTLPPAPGAPAPTIPPALEPVLAPVIDALSGLTTPESEQQAPPAPDSGVGGTLEGLVQSLLGG